MIRKQNSHDVGNLQSITGDTQLLIFGMGYSASAIGEKVKDKFDMITVTNRSRMENDNRIYQRLMFDGLKMSEELAHAIAEATHILVSIAPGNNGDPVLNTCGDMLESALNLQWIGYLSSVGVYGNHNGAWVDEETRCQPVSRRSINRLKAENSWRDLTETISVPLGIFRLSGIYGPGRNAFVNIEKGRSRRLIKKGQVFNRVHRDDIAEGLGRAIELKTNETFNITDDEPAPPQDVVYYAHTLQGSRPPPEIYFETADLAPMVRSFYGENKRVSNIRSKLSLGMKYNWPDYRTALKAMWNNNSWR